MYYNTLEIVGAGVVPGRKGRLPIAGDQFWQSHKLPRLGGRIAMAGVKDDGALVVEQL